jgi:hypothetical protein
VRRLPQEAQRSALTSTRFFATAARTISHAAAAAQKRKVVWGAICMQAASQRVPAAASVVGPIGCVKALRDSRTGSDASPIRRRRARGESGCVNVNTEVAR